MTIVNDQHAVLSPAALEQLLRWQAMDWSTNESNDEGWVREAARAITRAEGGTFEQFSDAIDQLASETSPNSTVGYMSRALHGDGRAIEGAVADNSGLAALLRTVTEQAAGVDVAEIVTPNGLRLRADHTGEAGAYQTAVLVEDEPGRSDVLASGNVSAVSATDALRAAAQREHAVHGLDSSYLQLVDQQLARLHQLTATTSPDPAAPDAQQPDQPGEGWAAVVAQASGRDLREEPGWDILAAALDRAAETGWDVGGQLPAVVAQTPLPAHRSASLDLAYRVMDAVPDAVPPAPSVAQINGTEEPASGRQRDAAERAISPTPIPDRGPRIGR